MALSAGELGAPEDVFAKVDVNGDGQAGTPEPNTFRIYKAIVPLESDSNYGEGDSIDVNV